LTTWKKSSWMAYWNEDLRDWVEPNHSQLSLRRQCALLGISRASLYYEPGEESRENLALMRLIDRQYTRVPFYGSRQMTAWLQSQGHAVNRKRVVRLMRQMGIEAVYAKPKLSRAKDIRSIPTLIRKFVSSISFFAKCIWRVLATALGVAPGC
jgi:putative transposase